MATLTVKVPECLAEKVQPFSRWLATILEISVLPLETKTADVARDIVKFLASNPSEDEVVRLELSSAAKERSKRLLILSDAEALNPEETRELDELEKLEQNVPRLRAAGHVSSRRAVQRQVHQLVGVYQHSGVGADGVRADRFTSGGKSRATFDKST